MLIDSHCHLNDPSFQDDFKSVIGRAQQAGVNGFLSICTKQDEIEALKAFSESYPFTYCSVGVHPHEAQTCASYDLESLKAYLIKQSDHEKVVGFGETGLDAYYNHSPLSDQDWVFRAHIRASLETELPLIIHTRDAEELTVKILQEEGAHRGVVHCFSGSHWLAEHVLDLGFYISVSGIITFKKADDLRAVIKDVPLERLLVETDAPYLAPMPYRGKRNEPSFVIHTARMLAEIKGVPFEEVALRTTRNFFSLFGKAQQ